MSISKTAVHITACLALLLAGAHAGARKSDRDQPVEISADQSQFDAETGFTLITGNVEIRQGTLEVFSDQARVFMDDGRMSRILLDGAPARWKQQLDSGKWMDARSAQIDYDVNAAEIVLIGDAVVNHPQGQITGDRITYDLDAETLRSDSDAGGRIRMRIEPDLIDKSFDQDDSGGGAEDDGPAASRYQDNGAAGSAQAGAQAGGVSDAGDDSPAPDDPDEDGGRPADTAAEAPATDASIEESPGETETEPTGEHADAPDKDENAAGDDGAGDPAPADEQAQDDSGSLLP